jgi:uncharacterized protein
MMVKDTVLITGGSGFVGSYLTAVLLQKGYKVNHLSRTVTGKEPVKTFKWDLSKGYIEEGAIENADYIIHLAGASIGDKPWTAERKKLIIESRVNTAKLLFEKVSKSPLALKAFISASAVGYYGTQTSEHIFNEEEPAANDFTGLTCKLWEEGADKFKELGKRVVKLRCAIVLGPDGGALKKMALPVKLWAGAALGSGKQYFPWIHLDDLCHIYLKAIEDETMEGAYNATAPEQINNEYLMKSIAKVLRKPFFMPNVPGFALKLFLGELGNAVLKGSRVSPQKIINKGYIFKYPELIPALEQALRK